MKEQKFLPWVIPEQCEGCTECVNVCPTKCLYMGETSNPEVFIPWMDNTDLCTGCGKCQDVCTWFAISLTSYVDAARERFLNKGSFCKSI
ncbi:MAG: 4Fe-4S binding protein [Draconibacterium sp.]|nr:4Fe-4S binding protein [Draconibacterium sp.]